MHDKRKRLLICDFIGAGIRWFGCRQNTEEVLDLNDDTNIVAGRGNVRCSGSEGSTLYGRVDEMPWFGSGWRGGKDCFTRRAQGLDLVRFEFSYLIGTHSNILKR